jgi:hypothetical protein
MKKSLLILILLFLVIPLFAEFNLGIIVDEFGDPTGENFLYTSSLGSYIDANMIESECYVRTTVDVWDLNGGLYLGFTFETHENEWSNPTRKAKVDSDATIKVKDEDGVVYSFSTSNSKYSTDTWNELTGKDALQFYELLINNKLLKVIIYYDALKYQFSIDCPNFESIFDEFARSIDTTLDIKKWHVENDYC